MIKKEVLMSDGQKMTFSVKEDERYAFYHSEFYECLVCLLNTLKAQGKHVRMGASTIGCLQCVVEYKQCSTL